MSEKNWKDDLLDDMSLYDEPIYISFKKFIKGVLLALLIQSILWILFIVNFSLDIFPLFTIFKWDGQKFESYHALISISYGISAFFYFKFCAYQKVKRTWLYSGIFTIPTIGIIVLISALLIDRNDFSFVNLLERCLKDWNIFLMLLVSGIGIYIGVLLSLKSNWLAGILLCLFSTLILMFVR